LSVPDFRSFVWQLLRWPSRLACRRALARRKFILPEGAPILSYGGVLPRAPGAIVAGGRVKLRHLERAFPEQEHFNVLYLVSSALPPHAAELVRWAKARGAKLVWNQNGVAFPAWAGGRCAETNRPMAELRRLADFVVYQSEFCRESADRFLGEVRCPSRVLFNPVDLAEFSPAPLLPPQDCWQLLTAGTHYQPWRVLGPIEALRQLRAEGHPARLVVAGALRWPDAEREVRDAVSRASLADAVTLRPAFTQAEAVALYRDAHLLLHPKYHDPCPTVVIEALACGLPVVGSRSGGMPELVGDDGGELIDVPLSWDAAAAPDPSRIAKAVVRLMQDWPARHAAARARAQRQFAAERWVAAHREVFGQVLRA
jgi:glycosyltransferase involved in cell wall biosynthesis